MVHPPARPRTRARVLAWRLFVGLVLAASSAVLLTLAFPPYGLWPLVWVGFVPALVAQYRVMPRQASSLASAVAIGGWLGGYLGPVFGGTRTYMTLLPLIVGALVFVMDMGKRAFHERTGFRWFVLEGATGWVGVELIRNLVPVAGTWAFVANTLYGLPWFIQPVSVFSIFGLSLLIMLVNYALAQWALAALAARPVDGLRARRWLVGVALVVVVWTGMSLVQFAVGTSGVGGGGSRGGTAGAAGGTGGCGGARALRVAAVHHAGGRPPRGENVADYAAQTREAARQGAKLVVWPEVGIKGDPKTSGTEGFTVLASETGAHLVLGYFVPVTERVWRNEATVLTPAGEFLGVFGKDHPVVFGGETSPTRGTYPVYDTELGKVATIICYDLDFTDTPRKHARGGARLIGVPSYDWPAIATKHYTHLVFRAVENRVAMVKSDGTGNDSAIIDPFGRIVGRAVTPGGSSGALVADVALVGGGGLTLACRLGDWVGWLCLAGMVFFMVLQPLTGSRRR